MAYIVNNSRGQVIAVVEDGTINTTATSQTLVGRNVTPYGEYEVENLVHQLENFADDSPPPNPIEGQLWWNTATDKMFSWQGDPLIQPEQGQWKPIYTVYFDVDEPTYTLNNGDLWYNPATQSLSIRNDTVAGSWAPVNLIQVAAAPPANALDGQMYFDNTSDQLFVYRDNAWYFVGPENVSDFAITRWSSEMMRDTDFDEHAVIVCYVDAVALAIVTKDAFTILPADRPAGFETLVVGINLLPTIEFKGLATSASKLSPGRLINGILFDGTSDIVVPTSGVSEIGITAGPGISVQGGPIQTQGNITVNNTGILSIAGGTGINATTYLGQTFIENTGIVDIQGGDFITVERNGVLATISATIQQGPPGIQGPPGPQGPAGENGQRGDRYFGLSTTPVTMRLGEVFFVTDNGLALTPAQPLIMTNTASTYMEGRVISYNRNSGQLLVNVLSVVGSGTYADWVINVSGLVGPQGTAGAQGPQGATGPAGSPGQQGATGPQGPQGDRGPPGPTTGIPGPTGPQGPAGPAGAAGATGPIGPAGAPGDRYSSSFTSTLTPLSVGTKSFNIGPSLAYQPGQSVIVSVNAENLMTGVIQSYNATTGAAIIVITSIQGGGSYAQWAISLAGAVGAQGPAGPQGPPGPQGPIGPTGTTGPQGPVGPAGAVGPQGPQGPQGDRYSTSSSNTFTIASSGTYTITVQATLAYSSGQSIIVAANGSNFMQATVSSYNVNTGQLVFVATSATGSGTYTSWTVNLAGATGAPGPQGPVGPAGAVGPQGATGAVGPAGPQGATGPQGPAGSAGPPGPQGITGPAGSTGPAGPAGPAGVGVQGAAGPAGPAGPAGAQGLPGPAGDRYSKTFSEGSSTTIGTGLKTFLPGQGLAYTPGQTVIVAADAARYMVGTVQTYNANTGSITINVTATQGSGTFNTWSLNLAGVPGPAGPPGVQGPQGPAGPAGPQGDRYSTTSTATLGINLGVQTFFVNVNLAYTPGQTVIIANSATRSMTGTVQSYNSGSGQMSVNVNSVTGSGTYNSWTVNLAGVPGPIGPIGAQGPQGVQGPPGNNGTNGATGPQGPAGTPGTQVSQNISIDTLTGWMVFDADPVTGRSIIVQWGRIDRGFANWTEGQLPTAAFPVAFPTACMSISMTYNAFGSNYDYWPMVYALDTATFTWWSQRSQSQATVPTQLFYIAVGY